MHPNVASVKYFLHAETLFFVFVVLSKWVMGMRLEVFLNKML
ncbi:hypothetical protein F947_00223 [Acinetobacter towneri DSM 14962 = CIP 107472]|nr:hypothetical protein F947_00223 [Acinetobacter towneri DSM 14962 = CIP 107472]